jgi:ribosomal protein L20A (L18A)
MKPPLAPSDMSRSQWRKMVRELEEEGDYEAAEMCRMYGKMGSPGIATTIIISIGVLSTISFIVYLIVS